MAFDTLNLLFLFYLLMTESEKHRLFVTGLVKMPLVFTLADLHRFKSIDVMPETSEANTDSETGLIYTGVPLRVLVEMAGISCDDHEDALFLRIKNSGGKSVFIPLDDVLRSDYSSYVMAVSLRRDESAACTPGTGLPGWNDSSLPCLVMKSGNGANMFCGKTRLVEVTAGCPENQYGRLLVIGVGPGDSSMLTLQSISAIAAADSFIASADIVERFGLYLAGRPVLYDPLECSSRYMAKKNPDMSPGQVRELVDSNRKHHGMVIADEIESGRTVAVLDYGDPTVYGSWSYWIPDVIPREKIKVFPAISSFNAGNGMVGGNIMYSGSAVITTPEGMESDPGLVSQAARHGDTVVIFLGLHDIDRLMPLLEKTWPADTPVAVAYKAGYEREEFLLRTDIAGMLEKIKQHGENHLALIYIGPCSGEKPAAPGKQ